MKCSSSGTLQSTIETVTLEWRLEWLLLHGDRKNCGVPLHSTVRVLSNAMEQCFHLPLFYSYPLTIQIVTSTSDVQKLSNIVVFDY